MKTFSHPSSDNEAFCCFEFFEPTFFHNPAESSPSNIRRSRMYSCMLLLYSSFVLFVG